MLGFSVHRLGQSPSWRYSLGLLKSHGFNPLTVIDVGVAEGTPQLYDAFPSAKIFLIDPTRESLLHMNKIAGRLNASILNIALGDANEEITIEVRPGNIGAASFFKDFNEFDSNISYPVSMHRFDEIIKPFPRPALCKIDVQGAEMMVLRGMGHRIREIDVFIIEASLLATAKNGPEVGELISFLSDSGFVLYDILSLIRRPLDHATAQVDCLFVRADSTLRANRRWE